MSLHAAVSILLWALFAASLIAVFGPELLQEVRGFWARGPLP